MPIPNRRGPRALSDILGDLFTARGYGRFLAQRELEEAWNAAVGEPPCRQTQLGEVRRGVLNVTVSHPALLEELAAFRKPELLAALRSARRPRRSTTSGSGSARRDPPRMRGPTRPADRKCGPAARPPPRPGSGGPGAAADPGAAAGPRKPSVLPDGSRSSATRRDMTDA